MIQKKAISLVEAIGSVVKIFPEEKALKMQGLINSIASFDVITSMGIGLKANQSPPHLAVMHNLITRGFPTFPSRLVEETMAKGFGRIIEVKDEILGEFVYKFDEKTNNPDLVFDAFHLVDSRLQLNDDEYNNSLLESSFEKEFVFKYLTGDNRYLRQLLLPQRFLTTIVNPNRTSNHLNQRVDLSVEIPYLKKLELTDRFGSKHKVQKQSGFIIEIDGPQHTQALLEDNNRDVDAKDALWETLRIKSGSEKADIEAAIKVLEKDSYLSRCKEINKRTLTGEWSEILQIVLSPIAVSRLQSVIVDYLISNKNYQKENSVLKIGIIERDVPCGVLAIKDLSELALNLSNLSVDTFSFPKIEFEIYSSNEFINSPLHKVNGDISVKEIIKFPWKDHNYDLVIDISVLRRSLIEQINETANFVLIRSSHFTERDTRRVMYTSKSITYKPLVKILQNDSYDLISENVNAIEYFLRNIFRKLSFLDGQLLILNRALQNQSVIGLLPTGGGKSLTYQLASLLQPGVVLVVDPIKSLMQDQFENLKDSGINSAIFINSTLTTTERKVNTARFETGEVMFCFISPERLIIKEFRDALISMNHNKIYFSYCVIDEVHCVSEWGHDFRTAYLSLGKNAVDFCKTGNGNPIPIFGLTATASFDVLADVERELSYRNNIGLDAIIRRENTIRDEIQYRIIKTEGNFEVETPFEIDGLSLEEEGPLKTQEYNKYKNLYVEKDVNIWKIQELIGLAKRKCINELILEVPEDLKNRFSSNELHRVLDQTFEKFLEEKDINEYSAKYKIPLSNRNLLKKEFIDRQLERIEMSDLDPQNFYDKECTNACIIFCPHRAWYFGVSDKYKWQKYTETGRDDEGRISHMRGDFVLDENSNKVPVPPSERKGIADGLLDPRFKVATFIGSGGENEKEEKKIQEDSFENQTAFIENKLNLMVATKAFGMGINKRNIRSTMHINMPSSLEGFVQEGGRAGRDRKIAVNYILINNQNFSVFDNNSRNKLILANKKQKFLAENELNKVLEILTKLQNKYFYREHFEILLKKLFKSKNISHVNKVLESIPVIHLDKDILMYFHNRSFKGRDKEKAVLIELRDRITYPNVPRLKILEERIKEELLIDELNISLWNEQRIYFNVGFNNSFGYLNLKDLRLVTSRAVGYESYHSSQVLQLALSFIEEYYAGPDSNVARASWLSEKQLLEPESGIERWVLDENVPVDAERVFKVHFENLYTDVQEYSKRLIQFWNKIFKDKNLVVDANQLGQCMPEEEDIDQYINNIENKFNININDLLSENQMNALKIRFYCRRKKEDTDKAIYRLQSIGLIDDYTVDYNNKIYHITVKKKEISQYVEALFEFIKRYYSEVKARKEIEKIDQTDKSFIIRNCINFLTDFIYHEIEKKRRVAIDDMMSACVEGSDGKNLDFKEFVYTYFNSKFARREYIVNGTDYSLLSEENTDNGKIQSLEIVWKFINALNLEISGSQVDNLKHLRGACLRILRSNPDNATLNLLKAYALFILGAKNENLLSEASASFFKGFTEFRSFYYDMNTDDFNKMIEKFKNLVLDNTQSEKVKEIIKNMTALLYVQLTANKFHQFKTKFIEDYGR